MREPTTELDVMASQFGASDAIFKVTIDHSGDLDFKVKDPYTPPMTDDPVESLIAATWSESLNKTSGCFEASVNVETAYSNILIAIRKVCLTTSPLKNPKQSKLYKWLYEKETRYYEPLAVGFIALYRYIIANDIGDKRSTDPHAKNVIAVLELIREKHER